MASVRHRLGIGNVLKGKGQGNVNESDAPLEIMRADSTEIFADSTIYTADGEEQQ